MRTKPTIDELDTEDWDLLKQVQRVLPAALRGVPAMVWLLPTAARYSPEVVDEALRRIGARPTATPPERANSEGERSES